jgi:hypothetical protein
MPELDLGIAFSVDSFRQSTVDTALCIEHPDQVLLENESRTRRAPSEHFFDSRELDLGS